MSNKKYNTSHVAKELNITSKKLRRYLRQFPEYNDGHYTHYSFTEKEKANIVKTMKLIMEENYSVKDALKETRKKNKAKAKAKTEA